MRAGAVRGPCGRADGRPPVHEANGGHIRQHPPLPPTLHSLAGEWKGVAVAQSFSKARFLTVQEVADLMRVSSMTVYRLIKAGDLPAVRVGRSFRVSESDVDAYLASRYTQAG